MTDREELKQMYKLLSHRADQRLVELEKLSSKYGYGDILNYAYRGAMWDIRQIRGEGSKRFRTSNVESWDVRTLRANINRVQSFLDADTSTIGGIKSVERRKIESFNKTTGLNLTREEFIRFIESKQFEKMINLFGSSQIGRVVHYSKDVKKELKNAKQWAKYHGITSTDKINDRAKEKFLEKHPNSNAVDYQEIKSVVEKIPSITKFHSS